MKPSLPSIDQLQELGLPAPVSYAPHTWGWCLLLGLLLVALLACVARRLWQWRRDRYRREALQRLAQLQTSSDPIRALRELPELLKRVALSMPTPLTTTTTTTTRRSWLASDGTPKTTPSPTSIAAMNGPPWQAFLSHHSNTPLPADFSQQLARLAYAPDAQLAQLSALQRQQLFDTCKHWVEQHHVAV